jgi:hypothetical protein
MRSPEGDLNRPYPSKKALHSEAEAARHRQSSGQCSQRASVGGVGIAGVLQKRGAQERKNETLYNSQHQGLYTEIWRRGGRLRLEGCKVGLLSILLVCPNKIYLRALF